MVLSNVASKQVCEAIYRLADLIYEHHAVSIRSQRALGVAGYKPRMPRIASKAVA
jgi:hypothetical protein